MVAIMNTHDIEGENHMICLMLSFVYLIFIFKDSWKGYAQYFGSTYCLFEKYWHY